MVVILLSLLVAVVMLPLVGLAIDGSILYLVQAKLSAAVDAAALAESITFLVLASIALADSVYLFPSRRIEPETTTPTPSRCATSCAAASSSLAEPESFAAVLLAWPRS